MHPHWFAVGILYSWMPTWYVFYNVYPALSFDKANAQAAIHLQYCSKMLDISTVAILGFSSQYAVISFGMNSGGQSF